MRNGRAGFTLIELLIVVVVIGILAAIASAKFSEVRTRSFMAVMQNDLKSVATKQEIYYAEALTYGGDLTTIEAVVSPGVIVNFTNNTSGGWSAQATHEGDSDIQCGVYVGNAPAAGGAPATAPDQVICTN